MFNADMTEASPEHRLPLWRAYAEFFAEPYPVRTTVGSDLYDILVEIDVVAVLPESR